MNTKYFRAATVLLGTALTAIAFPSDEALDLSSREIAGPFIAEALQNNPGLKAHDKRYLASKTSIEAAGVLPNPKIQITHFVESIQTRTGSQEQAIMLQQPIPWPGKRERKRESARAQANSLWHAYAIHQFSLVNEVASNVFSLAYIGKSIDTTRENRSLLKRLERIVEDRVKSGGDLNDLLRIQIEIERFDDSIAQQETQRHSTSAKLESLLGRPPSDSPIPVSWTAPSDIVSAPSQWLAAIPDRSPQIAMLRSIASSLESRERLARLASRPDLTVGVNYIHTRNSPNPITPDNGNDPWALMVGASLPIWKKANNALTLQATLEREALNAQIKALKLQLLADGRSSIAMLVDSHARLKRYQTKLLPLARQSRDITQSSYQSGNATILELIDSERVILKLETEYWQAAANAWQARWKLATLSGGIWLN